MTDDVATAHHEAGHAVAAITFRRSVVHVSIERDDVTLGRVRHGADLRSYVDVGALSPRERNADIVVSWTGPLAEERCTGRFNEPGAQRDLDRAFELALEVSEGDAAEATAYMEWLRFRTARLLREPVVWSQVQAVAAALLERGALTGRQVKATMDATARRVPAP